MPWISICVLLSAWLLMRKLLALKSLFEKLFYLVHSMMSADREYARRDLDLAFAFAKSALDAGVRRIVYLGGLGETGTGLSEHLARSGLPECRLQSCVRL